MKKQLLLMLAVAMSLSTFAQKDELKAAEKALKSGDLTAAKSAVDQAESVIANDEKLRSKFYFLKAQTYYDIAKKNPSLDANAYDVAAKSFQDLIAYEKETGKAKYTVEAEPMLNSLIGDVSQKGIKEYQEKDFSKAKESLYKTYVLSPKDTAFLEYAANAAYLDKDYDKALKHFNSLKDLGYTGIATTYSATNVESGQVQNFASKNQMDLMVKSGQYKDPKVEVSESKKATVIKNIALILVEKGETEGAMAAVKEAREADPSDMGMLLTEANILLKLGKKAEFADAMKKAIEGDPTNATLYFNVGVINQEEGNIEEAKGYYRKAMELDPNYSDAYLNMGAALLEQDKELVDEMNKNLSNFKKYDQIKAKQVDLYKEVLPYYEKAFEIKKKNNNGTPDADIARTLMSLYENVGMDDKFKEMKAIWDASK
jgi:tetratricopeptide (TPR) repeat protein